MTDRNNDNRGHAHMFRSSAQSALAALAVIVALFVSTDSRAATFSNTSTTTIGFFGSPDTTTYGQVFTLASSQTLVDWTFYPSSGTAGNVRFVVATWDGSRAVAALYSVNAAYTGGASILSFPGINLNLAPGSYVAYITVAGVVTPVTSTRLNGSSSDGGLPGGFRFLNSIGVDPLTVNGSWTSFGVPNMQYTANLTPSAANTLAQNIACAQNLISLLTPNQAAGVAQRNLMYGLLNNVLAYQTQYRSLALASVNSALVRTDGCALRGSPDTVSGQGGAGSDFVTSCPAQAPIYACLKDAQTQLSGP